MELYKFIPGSRIYYSPDSQRCYLLSQLIQYEKYPKGGIQHLEGPKTDF